ncbi:MAG TPA: hypothetical protein DET40_23740 [Lentisphaeria bacterium]|nr:MAG: hypothetical protein A2X45_23955 [Lentisphaerae bacterium GWF2_50_93]HCE46570.1 hypothetical protein [Lentisphaeria bacterium]
MLGNILFIIFIVIFVLFFGGFCIFIHELGHFLAARWRGLHVIAFSIGFKKVWGYKYKGVDYRIGCIPFGGYVDLPQIDCTGQAKDENGNVLPPAKPIDRIITAFAGPLFNVLFGLVLGTFLWIHGIPQDTPRMASFEVATVYEESPEYRAGLRKGDLISKVNGAGFNSTWVEIVEKILFTVGDVSLGVKRGNENITIKYTPEANKFIMPEEGLGIPYFRPKIPVILIPLANSPAEKAGLKKDDIVLKVNGADVNGFDEFFDRVYEYAHNPLVFTISRQGKVFDVGDIKAVELPDSNIYRIGIVYTNSIPITVSEIKPSSPAEAAGIHANDKILKVNGRAVSKSHDLSNAIQQSGGDEIDLLVQRDGQPINIKLRAKLAKNYDIGILPLFYNHPNPVQQLVSILDKTYKSLRGMTSKKSTLGPRHMSGPIGIVNFIAKTVYYGGIILALNLIVMITFSLGIFNLLPIPVLDGGHILLACIEWVTGKPMSEQLIKPVFVICISLLIGLMAFVTFYDMKRIYTDVKAWFVTESATPAPVKKEPPPPVANEVKP